MTKHASLRFAVNNMENCNIVADAENQEKSLLDAVPLKLKEEERLESKARSREWLRLNGFGFAWDTLGFFLFFVFESNNALQQVSEYVSKQTTTTLCAQVCMLLVLVTIQIVLIQRFGSPGIFMSRQLKINVGKSVNGMIIYLVVLMISMVSSTHILNFSLGNGDRLFCALFCALFACIYNFSYATFLLGHASAALVLFPLKFLTDNYHPPSTSKTIYCLKFCTLGAIEALVYIVAISTYQEKNCNRATEVFTGDSCANLLAKDVVRVTEMIIIPVTRTGVLYFIIICGYLIVNSCILRPSVALARRNGFL